MKKLLLLLLLTSCVKTEIIGISMHPADTLQTKGVDTTFFDGRIPIGFNPSVEDWNSTEIDY